MSVYLDHAATTPLSAEALAALTRELVRTGNPSSLHGSGRRARRSVEDARETIATAAGAHPSEVIFT
ncbi:MAG TPA: cysteine desulfurase NifS, partial [Arthrobacter bacterium]|nr:cysteine desulfurase NifS [Arthrobacter sp.]